MQQSSDSTPTPLKNDVNQEIELPKIFDFRCSKFENYMKTKEENNEVSVTENVESNKAVILLQDENKLEQAEVSSDQSSLMTVVKEKIAEIICNNKSTRLEKSDNETGKKV